MSDSVRPLPNRRRIQSFVALVIAGILCVLVVWWLRPAPPETTRHADPVQVVVAPAEPEVVEPEPSDAPTITASADTAPVPVEPDGEPALSLDGYWAIFPADTARVWTDDYSAASIVKLTQDGKTVDAVEVSGKRGVARTFSGTIEDERVAFPSFELFGVMWNANLGAPQGAQPKTIQGVVSRDYTRIRLDGEHPVNFNDPNSVLSDIQLVMTKLDDATAETERTVRELAGTVRELRDAILAYAYDHRGRLPRQLSDLVPEYIANLDAVSDDEALAVTYNGDARDISPYGYSNADLKRFRPELSTRDRLLQWEAELAAQYGGGLPAAEILLQVRVGRTPATVSISFRGDPEVTRGEPPEQTSARSDDLNMREHAGERAKIEACQHQLKHIGLAFAMFREVTDEGFTPAGWLSILPELIESPAMLTCPNHNPGTFSYQIAFPATNLEQLTAIYADIHGLDPEAVNRDDVGASVPIVFEETPHTIGGDAVRQVLYLDGHVQSVPVNEWDEVVGPYLQYSVR